MNFRPFVAGVVILAILIVMVFGIFWGISAEYDEAPEVTKGVQDEELVVEKGNWTRVDAPEYALRFYDNESVTNASSGTLDDGTDYEWNTSDGTIYFYPPTNDVNDGEIVHIDYWYAAKEPTARRVFSVLDGTLSVALPSLILISVGLTIAGLAIALARWSRRARTSRSFGRR